MALTDREKKILELQAKGLSNYQIGRELRIWPETVVRSRRNAACKIRRAKADLQFAERLNYKT